ncbi:laminin subunit alpha-3-like [Carassius carassius]|uniref:laminin subunit alpha-3-like n=1 Tax=Carassius carassius TaxID=217509 RepID=UPI00286891AE|nr:laminin subunit alpha-3-like [Carassius carassius]
MDDEFSKLKTQLELYTQNATSLTELKKLEDAIAGTKVLVHKYTQSVFALKPKVLELESDLKSIIDDLTFLSNKALEMFCTAIQLLKTLDQTYQRGDNLRSESLKLLQKIQEFLEELKRSNQTGGNTEAATRMIKEARSMLEKMQRQSCRVQRELANEELRKAQTLLNLIVNDLMVPVNGSLEVADRIRQKLMDQAEDLKDIKEALTDAQRDVIKANDVNKLNEEQLRNFWFIRRFIRSITSSTAVQKAIEAIKAFTSVIDAIKEAEAAAKHTKEVADRAFEDVRGQDLQISANDLKNFANTLLEKAKEAEIQLEDVMQKCEAYKDLIQMAKDKQNSMQQVLQDLLERIKNIKRDDIPVLINEAKEGAADVNATADDAKTRMQNISEELNKIKISSLDSNLTSLLDGVNKTLSELDQSFPSLINKLNKVMNQSGRMPSSANISSGIQKIKDLIEQTRDAANRIRGPILFSGDAHIELRPPKDLEDFRTFTVLNLSLHQPISRGDGRRRSQLGEDNQFVLYLGNKHTVRDFIGLVVKDGVLFCVYKVGGRFYEIKTSEITKSDNAKAFMDRVDFRRVYQDAQVIYTEIFTSTAPNRLPPMINKPNDMNGLLDLDPNEVVLYVGGYPDDFEPPKELRYPGYKGCIEFSTLNDRILGLYNFQRAINIMKTDMCQRYLVFLSDEVLISTSKFRVIVPIFRP